METVNISHQLVCLVFNTIGNDHYCSIPGIGIICSAQLKFNIMREIRNNKRIRPFHWWGTSSNCNAKSETEPEAVNKTFSVTRSDGRSLISVKLQCSFPKSGSSKCRRKFPCKPRMMHHVTHSSLTDSGKLSRVTHLISWDDTITLRGILMHQLLMLTWMSSKWWAALLLCSHTDAEWPNETK